MNYGCDADLTNTNLFWIDWQPASALKLSPKIVNIFFTISSEMILDKSLKILWSRGDGYCRLNYLGRCYDNWLR